MCSSINEEKRNLLRKKNIGFIYQNFFLLDSFSALENIKSIPEVTSVLTSGGKSDAESG